MTDRDPTGESIQLLGRHIAETLFSPEKFTAEVELRRRANNRFQGYDPYNSAGLPIHANRREQ